MNGFRMSGRISMVGLIGFIFVIAGCGKPNVGLTDGRFAQCPDSPNCVSSMAKDQKHFIEPIAYEGGRAGARQTMLSVIRSMKRSRIISESDTYIHAEFRSFLFRFVDDVELFFPENTPVIHMKSASRTGYSDFGVNRKRLAEIRQLFNEHFSKAK